MEKLARVQQEFALTRRRSDAQLSAEDGQELAILTEQMAAAYPHQELAESLEILMRGFEILALEFGIRGVRDALEAALTRQKFFPHPSEIREAIKAMKAAKKSQVFVDNPFVPCGRCDEGYVRVNRDGTPWDGRNSPAATAMRECSCRVAWREKLQRLMGPDKVEAAAAAGNRTPEPPQQEEWWQR